MRVRAIIAAVFCSALCVVPVAVPAQEGPGVLPRESPAERQMRDLNRSILDQERSLQREQQYRIDRNQLRQDFERRRNFPEFPAIAPGNCPPGSAGCGR